MHPSRFGTRRKPGQGVLVCGLWFMVHGLWFIVYDLWFIIHGLGFMVYDLWFGLWFEDQGLGCENASITWLRVSGFGFQARVFGLGPGFRVENFTSRI